MAEAQRAPLLQGEIKKGRASLVGGVAVGIAVMVLWWALVRELGEVTPTVLAAGAVVASVIAAYIRIADL